MSVEQTVVITREGPSRLDQCFEKLKIARRTALITYITAGDPDLDTSQKILNGLPSSGVDIIELSFPFSDPMADGPVIQEANQRAFKSGMTLKKVLKMVDRFRKHNQETPLILMGYYNPIYRYGVKTFVHDAKQAGVDGLIIVDLPPEEEAELGVPALTAGLDMIRLITPTTTKDRLKTLLRHARGFLYYVSVAGITGTKSGDDSGIQNALQMIRSESKLPIGVGFGIRTHEQANRIAKWADAVIIGSAVVERIQSNLKSDGSALPSCSEDVLSYIKTLATAVHSS